VATAELVQIAVESIEQIEVYVGRYPIAFGGAVIAIIVAASEYTRGSIELWQAFAIIMLGAEFFIPL